jgi:hypothetical protein
MREVEVSCDGEVFEDGSCTLTISVKNLTVAEAQAIGDRAEAPFREIVNGVLHPEEQMQ